jgi:hypothetical protein
MDDDYEKYKLYLNNIFKELNNYPLNELEQLLDNPNQFNQPEQPSRYIKIVITLKRFDLYHIDSYDPKLADSHPKDISYLVLRYQYPNVSGCPPGWYMDFHNNIDIYIHKNLITIDKIKNTINEIFNIEPNVPNERFDGISYIIMSIQHKINTGCDADRDSYFELEIPFTNEYQTDDNKLQELLDLMPGGPGARQSAGHFNRLASEQEANKRQKTRFGKNRLIEIINDIKYLK